MRFPRRRVLVLGLVPLALAAASLAAQSTGHRRATGPQGSPGAAGAQGPRGTTGPAGPAGATGPAGPRLGTLDDLNGTACHAPGGRGTLSIGYNASTGAAVITCTFDSGGGGSANL